MVALAATPWAEPVDQVRQGPPAWAPTRLGLVDERTNTVEFFVHHEDVLRTEPGYAEPRALGRAHEQAPWRTVSPDGPAGWRGKAPDRSRRRGRGLRSRRAQRAWTPGHGCPARSSWRACALPLRSPAVADVALEGSLADVAAPALRSGSESGGLAAPRTSTGAQPTAARPGQAPHQTPVVRFAHTRPTDGPGRSICVAYAVLHISTQRPCCLASRRSGPLLHISTQRPVAPHLDAETHCFTSTQRPVAPHLDAQGLLLHISTQRPTASHLDAGPTASHLDAVARCLTSGSRGPLSHLGQCGAASRGGARRSRKRGFES